MATLTPEQIARETVTLYLKVGKLGIRKTRDARILNEDADQDLVHVGADIIDKNADVLKAIRARISQAKTWIKARAVPVKILAPGFYPIPVDLVPAVDQYLEEFREQLWALVESFGWQYQELKADAKARLEPLGLYDADDYPEVDRVKAAFTVKAEYSMTINLPAALAAREQAVYKQIYDRCKLQAESKWADATDQITSAVREAMAKMVTRVTTQLTPGPDGKRRKLHDSMLQEISVFLDTFQARNLTGDQDLETLVQQARTILTGVTTDGLKTDDTMREHVGAAFEQIGQTLDGMIVAAPARRIRLEPDEPSTPALAAAPIAVADPDLDDLVAF